MLLSLFRNGIPQFSAPTETLLTAAYSSFPLLPTVVLWRGGYEVQNIKILG